VTPLDRQIKKINEALLCAQSAAKFIDDELGDAIVTACNLVDHCKDALKAAEAIHAICLKIWERKAGRRMSATAVKITAAVMLTARRQIASGKAVSLDARKRAPANLFPHEERGAK
jgi:hypothetical protein